MLKKNKAMDVKALQDYHANRKIPLNTSGLAA
jgi:hypothetical protein